MQEKFKGLLRERLRPGRYIHSLGVSEMAGKLAQVHGVDREKAEIAGLVHDIARDLPPAQLLKLASEFGIMVSRVEESFPELLHPMVGAGLLEFELGFTDPQILQAVRFHTTGHPGMSTLDKIIYLADLIEPGRDFPGVERLRWLSVLQLDHAVLEALEQSLQYLICRGKCIHPNSVEARNHLLVTQKGR